MSTILNDYIAKHPGSAQRYEYSSKLFPGGVTHDIRYTQPFPLFMTHGQGPLKWDVDGNEYVDYVSGHGALILGHSHPAIVEAVSRQISCGTHLGANTNEETRWAMAIKALVPSVEKLRFHSSGTEATLMAMRLSRAFTSKQKIVMLKNHFHGWHDYAMVEYAMGSPGIPDATSASVVILPAGDLNAVENLLSSDRDIAGLILEPTGAHFGQLPLDAGNYLTDLRMLTKEHQIVLIFDEVVTGFRVSPGGAQVLYGVNPDLTTMAKIVAGGLPGGAVGGRADIIDMMSHRGNPDWDNSCRVYHPGTFNANPISAVAGATCLELLADQPINRQADAMATRLKTGLNEIFEITDVAGHAHGVASVIHLVMAKCECDREICSMAHQKIKEALASPAVSSLKRSLQNCGIDIMGPNSFLVSALHGANEIERTLEAFQVALKAAKAEGLV